MTGGKCAVVAIPEEATIRNAENIADQLNSALAASQTIEIDCSAIAGTDSSFLQLLIAARKSAVATGKHLTLSAPAAGALRDAVIECGLAGGSLAAFWTEGRAAR